MQSFQVRLVAITIGFAMVAGGCASGPMSPRESGALGGAAIGAGSGALIGSASGDTAEGALIGGAVGAIAGAIIGDSVQAREQRMARDAALAEELRRQDLDARSSDRGVVVNLPDVLFEFGRAELSRSASRKVASIADVLSSRGVAWRRVSIEGHTDSIGSEQSNEQLSQRRAQAVANALMDRRVTGSRLAVQGFGEAYPVVANVYDDGSDNPQGRARNRRVEVVILNEEGDQYGPEPTGYPQDGYNEPYRQGPPQGRYPPGPPRGGYPGGPPSGGYPPRGPGYPPGPPPYGY